MELNRRLPTSLLTGFLGSGKTTLVNHILSGNHGRKIGVIVNEFGELGIDAALIRGAAGSVIELANGCVCCATQGDLSRSLRDIAQASSRIEALLIETSGLADPQPVVAELETGHYAPAFRLDGVITVIDAANFDRNLEHAEAAFQQIVAGDLLVINKTDLVDEEIPGLIENGIRKINTEGRFLRTVQCQIPLDVVFGLGRRVAPEAAGAHPIAITHDHGSSRTHAQSDHHAHEHHHAHDDFTSVSIRIDEPLDFTRFTNWLDQLGDNVFRAKGFVRFADSSENVIVHVVGTRRSIEPSPQDISVAGAAFVVIGKAIDPTELRAGLQGCAV